MTGRLARTSSIVAAVVMVGVVAACSGGPDNAKETSSTGSSGTALPSSASTAGVTINVPKGWASRQLGEPGGLLISEDASDFDVANPNTVRVTIMPFTDAAPTVDELFEDVAASPCVGSMTATEVTVGGLPAAALDCTFKTDDGQQALRFITMPLGNGKALTVVVEGEAYHYVDVRVTVDDLLKTAEIDVDKVPLAT